MRCSKGFPQSADLDLAIKDGGLDRGVAAEFLEAAPVGASLKKGASHRLS
jgi:hypothetical protein